MVEEMKRDIETLKLSLHGTCGGQSDSNLNADMLKLSGKVDLLSLEYKNQLNTVRFETTANAH